MITWNERYANPDFIYGKQPNDYFKAAIDSLPPGRVLIPAAGEGRDAIYAAKLGWEVYAFDASSKAQEKALKWANEERLNLHYFCDDAMNVRLPLDSFDVIALIFFHLPVSIRAEFHQKCIKWLKPGGLLVLEGFTPKQLPLTSGGPKDLSMLFTSDLLNNDFSDLTQIELNEFQRTLDEGPLHQGLAEVVQFKGKKIS